MKSKTKFKQLLLLLLVFTFSAAIAFGQDCGDVNADGSTDIVDALLAAQCYVGLINCPPAEIGDVNCDGSIDIVDALLLAQFYVGLGITLDCCEPPPTDPPPTDPPPTDPPGEDVTLEMQAEDAAFDGDVESDHSGYTGSGYVNTPNEVGAWIEWTIDVDRDCNAECVFTYATSGSGRPMDLSVNGNGNGSLSFPDTGAWTTWSTETADIILSTGSNAIRLTATSSGGAPNMDKMDITIFNLGANAVHTDPCIGWNYIQFTTTNHVHAGTTTPYIYAIFGADHVIKLYGESDGSGFKKNTLYSYYLCGGTGTGGHSFTGNVASIPSENWNFITLKTPSRNALNFTNLRIRHSSAYLLKSYDSYWLDAPDAKHLGLAGEIMEYKLSTWGNGAEFTNATVFYALSELGTVDSSKFGTAAGWCSEFAAWCLRHNGLFVPNPFVNTYVGYPDLGHEDIRDYFDVRGKLYDNYHHQQYRHLYHFWIYRWWHGKGILWIR